MTTNEKNQCSEIINQAKIKAGIKGSGLSMTAILTDMTIKIGEVFGRYDIRNNMPSDLKANIFAYGAGSSANKLLTGWIPFAGKAINHASAAMCTDECGWNAANYFDKHRY